MDAAGLPGRFNATVFYDDAGIPIVAVSGEIDLATSPELQARIDEVISRAESRCLVVDLCEVEFMDVAGLNVLIGARREIQEHRGGMLVVACGDRVRRLFEFAGLTQSFTLCASLRAAGEKPTSPALR